MRLSSAITNMFARSLGQLGEDYVACEYRKRGYKIVGKNVREFSGKQVGEIDIIVVRKRELVFVEVKTRSSDAFMNPAEAVNLRKQAKLLRAAKIFLQKNPRYDHFALRFDVAVVIKDLDGRFQNAIIIEDAIQDTA